MESIFTQILWLTILAIPIACISWTVTHEEVFKEPRRFCYKMSKKCNHILKRKFFYLFTCEYCFSHYIALGILLLTNFTIYSNDWKGSVIAFFALVWVANVYMSLYAFVRMGLKNERLEADIKEQELDD